MVKARWQEGKAGLPVHAHMIRHATGFTLANAGKDTRSIQAYLGHQGYSAYSKVYRAVADAIQGLLSRREEGRIIG